ncbi:MAG: CHAD domain-containing protein [Candidatus Acidiferrales bacterium]
MSRKSSFSPIAPNGGVGIAIWMGRVLARANRAAENWDSESVHDLRVALRRCRAMAGALNEVSPDPGWRKVKKSSRPLFRALGSLRDTQVEREWVTPLAPPGEPLRTHMLRLLARREKKQRENARETLGDFSAKEWKNLSRKLGRKAELFLPESVVFQRVALARLQEAAELLFRARKRRSARAWHGARIGLKHFRYVAENFLPRRYELWAADLKHLQDLLGEIHDLDVLRADIRRNATKSLAGSLGTWLDKIEAERKIRIAEVIARTTGDGSLLHTWQSSLEIAHMLTPAPQLSRRSA